MTIDYITITTSTKKNIINIGLRKYLISIYQYVAFALAVTSCTTLIVANSQELMYIVHSSPLRWVITLSPLLMAFYMSHNIISISRMTAYYCLIIFSILIGFSLSSVFLVFTGESIIRVLSISSSTFVVMSFYGYQCKKDLSSITSFLLMGSIGISIAGISNILIQSTAIHFISSAAGVVISTLFTAYNTQKIKELYHHNNTNKQLSEKLGIYGALTLYMDFINLFVFLLQILGIRRND